MTSTLFVLVLLALGVIAVVRARREDRRFTLAPWPPKLPPAHEAPPPTVYVVEDVWDAGAVARRFPRSIVLSELRRAKHIVTVFDAGQTMVSTQPTIADAYDGAVRWLEERRT